tara:strand:- start:161 stop:865 length:705 start_codon:yes stop_codon:yes gene_type:complete
MKFDFNAKDTTWIFNIDDELQTSVVEGNVDDAIERVNLEDNVNGDNLTYDTESNKIFKRPNPIICIQGALNNEMYWTTENITASDIDRLKTLWADDKIRSGTYTESETAEAITNKKFCTTYEFSTDYDVLSPMSIKWNLAVPGRLKAAANETRLFCMLSDRTDYEVKVLDIASNGTKVLERDQTKTLSYVFFSQECELNGSTTVGQYQVKKLTSDSVSIKNKGTITARIILMHR